MIEILDTMRALRNYVDNTVGSESDTDERLSDALLSDPAALDETIVEYVNGSVDLTVDHYDAIVERLSHYGWDGLA